MELPEEPGKSDFERLAEEQRDLSLLAEFWLFLRENRKWWMIPILAVFLLLGVMLILSGTAAAPFIYTLF